MDVFNQFTVGLKKQEQLKMEFVESLTKLQLLKKKLKKTFLHFRKNYQYIYICVSALGSDYLNSHNCRETITTDHSKVYTRLSV